MLHDPRIALHDLDDFHATLDRAHLVPPPRPLLRRRCRDLHLHLPHGRLVAACCALPAAWTTAMIVIAWTLRY